MITQSRAVEIAQDAIEGKVTTQPNAPITVELENDQYIVVFERADPPGTRGPDYDAKVTIHAETGQVLDILGGS